MLILIVFILVVDNRKKGNGKTEQKKETTALETPESVSEETEEAEETHAETETRAPYDHANSKPERTVDETLTSLAERYFDARTKGDASEMHRLFGISDTGDLEALQKKMTAEKKLYESFENTCVYRVPGVSEDDWILYVMAQGWFRKIETPAPVFFRMFAVKDNEGNYILKEDSALTEAEKAAIEAADASAEVKKLSEEQRTNLAKAIVSDAKLGSLYERLKVGGTEPETLEETSEETSIADAEVEVGENR